ncbi:uncharacterized protein KY384_007625 [Bacidia gigantensis]|uniref:uncharacterized protein n=1 Tax=Bacidia gigantensis TaxID=2732470 RepID=UPI001D042B55|nr:uncharacterized protein KY384_007625 [Bacidia gigantensis]KAG8527473.1 hypothetical protein KY384_007625 [Bacidia gigantensis]
MALRIAPSSSHATSISNTGSSIPTKGAPSAPGLHDTLRTNLSLNEKGSFATSSSETTTQSTHPLESRLRNWQSTQDQLKSSLLRKQYGIGEPVRRGMELKVCREGEYRPQCLGGSANVGGDILAGRDCEMGWEDIYWNDGSGPASGEVQAEMDSLVGAGEW